MHSWPPPQVPEIPGRGGEVLVHDSATGRMVPAAKGNRLGMYVCGVTPYDATHVGHAATYVATDVLRRALEDSGVDVRHTSNVTDVDDPLLVRARELGADWRVLADDQTALFAEDMSVLGVQPPHTYMTAVESIPLVVDAVTGLLETGRAYRVPVTDDDVVDAAAVDGGLGDVYADLSADPEFGSVSSLDRATMLELFAERGGDPQRPGKRDPLDPLLWRRERMGEPAWDGGALGRGRPGWHVECAVIAEQGLGPLCDVQAGGSDLAFPHHEMSASHARVLRGPEAGPRVHVHTGMVGLHGRKMSKSDGNLVFVSELRAEGIDPMAIRLALLAHHYRSDWEWTDDGMKDAERRLERWRWAMSGTGGPSAEEAVAAVRTALASDLDTPRALAVVDDWCDTALDRGPQEDDDLGAPGVLSRVVNALLGVRL